MKKMEVESKWKAGNSQTDRRGKGRVRRGGKLLDGSSLNITLSVHRMLNGGHWVKLGLLLKSF